VSAVRRAIAAAALVTGVGAGVVAIAPTAAYADDGHISVNVGNGWEHDASAPLFDITNIFPGWTDSRTLHVRNDSDQTASLSLAATDVVEDENGCNHPESFADSTCGADEGELGSQLLLTAYVDPDNDGSFEATPTWTGTVQQLETATDLLGAVPSGGVVGLRLDAELPYASGNETQTDQVEFGLRLTLDGASTEVEGTKVVRHQNGGPATRVLGGLPFTGSPVERLVQAGLWAALAGGFLVLAGRSRRRRQQLAE
jgi:hypothetical protein